MEYGIGGLSRSMTGPICPLHPPARAFSAQAWFITHTFERTLSHVPEEAHS